MSVREAVMEAAAQLRASESPRLDAEVLLAHVLGWSRSDLFARDDEVLAPESQARFRDLVQRRAAGEPIAYLTGCKEFWSLRLKVTPDVLVPRPETELLVEWALERLQGKPQPQLADLGTGSGAIALALACERRDATVYATDSSAAALAVARHNAQELGLDNLRFLSGRWFAALDDLRDGGETPPRLDLLVSNPPYVAHGDPHLQDLRYEPVAALVAGGDGLADLREIISAAPLYLQHGAWLLLEHGATQAAAVRDLMEQAGFREVHSRRDLAGLERASGGRRP